MAVNFLTYNIHGLPWNRINVKGIADWIFRVSGSEAVCLQEVFSKTHRNYLVQRAESEGWSALYPEGDATCIPGLECGSGLLTLLHPRLTVIGEPTFKPFKVVNGVDRFVSKGYFKVDISTGLHNFQLFNTHMQSDVTEFWCYRLNYVATRSEQEKQLFLAATKEECPLILGDTNTCCFQYFHKVDPTFNITFPGTGEHLDHLLVLERDANKLEYATTIYHVNVPWSDHIPVDYCVRFIRRSGRV